MCVSCDGPSADLQQFSTIPAKRTVRELIADTLANPSETTLDLQGLRVIDQDLLLLANNKHITHIHIDDGDLSEQGLAPLATLENLVQIRIRLRLTDEAIPIITKIKSLRYLNIPKADFTDEGIKILCSHPNIELLRIGGERLSNSSLYSLATMQSLSFLHLIGVAINDEGLPALYDMPHLQSLYLDDTDVTDAGLVKLLEILPSLHLHINQTHIDRDPNKHDH